MHRCLVLICAVVMSAAAAFPFCAEAAVERFGWGNCGGMTPARAEVGVEGRFGPSTASYYWSEDWRYSKIDKWVLTMNKGEEVAVELKIAKTENSGIYICWLARTGNVSINNSVQSHGQVTLLDVRSHARACVYDSQSRLEYVVRCTDEYQASEYIWRKSYEICDKNGQLLAKIPSTYVDLEPGEKHDPVDLCMAVSSSQGAIGKEVHSYVSYSGRTTRIKKADSHFGGSGGTMGGVEGGGNVYTFVFSPGPNGSGKAQTVTVTESESVYIPRYTFSRNGYVQLGWVDSDGYEYEPGSYCAATGNKTFYPNWHKCYEAQYRPGEYGKGTSQSQRIACGYWSTLKGAIFTRNGYTQRGWKSSDGVEYELNAKVQFVKDEIYTPTWEPCRYTVTYDPGPDGSGSRWSGEKVHDQALTLPERCFTRKGYVQTGWFSFEDGIRTEYLSGVYLRNAPVTLYPIWQEGYLITYDPGTDANGEVWSVIKKPGVAHTISDGQFRLEYGGGFRPLPTRVGYRQVGWQATTGKIAGQVDIVTKYGFGETYAKDASTTFLPRWEKVTYKVQYVPGPYSSGDTNLTEKSYGGALYLRGATYKRENYLQIGWHDDTHGKDYGFGDTYAIDSEATFSPVWGLRSKYTYIVRCVPDDTSIGTETKLEKEFGVSLELPGMISSRPDYFQTGWTRTKGSSTAEFSVGRSAYAENSSAVLYPTWASMSKIGVSTNIMALVSGGEYKLSVSGAPAGDYSFCAWSSAPWVKTTISYTSREWHEEFHSKQGWTLPAGWSEVSATLGSGNLYAHLGGEVTVNLTFSVKENEDGIARCTTYLVKVDGTNYLAATVWQPGTGASHVEFDLCGGTGNVPTLTARYGCPLEYGVKPPTRLGYTFAGYFDEEAAGRQYYDEAMVPTRVWDKPKDAKLFAHWEPIVYAIRYADVKGVDNINPAQYAKGETILFKSLPNTAGYAFAGWSPSFIVPEDIGDQIVYATWREVSLDAVTIIFDPESGSGSMQDHELLADQVWRMPSCSFVPPAGKHFAGWQCSNGRRYDDGMLVFDLAKPGETVTMTAIWE